MPGSSAWASLAKFIPRNELHPGRANHRYLLPTKHSPRQQWRVFLLLTQSAGDALTDISWPLDILLMC